MSAINRIINGDCREVLSTLAPRSADLVVTDPPYLVNYKDRLGRSIANDRASDDDVLECFSDLYRVLKPDSFCISFYGWNRIDAFHSAWTRAGFSLAGHIVWHKRYASNARYLEYRHEQAYLLVKGKPRTPAAPLSDVQPWEYSGNRLHPTEKAVGILRPLVETFSRPSAIVLDPFAGSGSTLVAAALAGRNYIGIELERRYCQIADKRLAGAARYLKRKARH